MRREKRRVGVKANAKKRLLMRLNTLQPIGEIHVSLRAKILPHHGFHRLNAALVILGSFLAGIGNLDFPGNLEIDQLSDRHSGINANGLPYGDFQRPGIAEADISLSCRGMDIDSKPSDAAFPFQKGNMAVCFGVFLRYAEVQLAWNKN